MNLWLELEVDGLIQNVGSCLVTWVQIVQGIHLLLIPDNSLNQDIVYCGTSVRPQRKFAGEPEIFLGILGFSRRAERAAHRWLLGEY